MRDTLCSVRDFGLVAVVVVAAACSACTKSKTNPVTPTPSTTTTTAPAATTYTITGTVRESATIVITNATVTVVDGPNAGRSATTNAVGVYTITGLQFAGFSVSATAPNYIGTARGVALTSGVTTTTVDFQLARVAPAPPAGRTMTGTWTGTWSIYSFTMVLTQSGTTVSGTYVDSDGAGRTDPAEPGTFNDPNLTLRIKQSTFRDFTFRGPMDGTGRRVTGTVTAAGGTSSFTMNKQ